MTDPHSPIIDFYPTELELDMNGKKADWEAVVKIPFIDEKRLLKAMSSYEKQLTKEERKRNSFGESLLFSFDPFKPHVYACPIPGLFPGKVSIFHSKKTFLLARLPLFNCYRQFVF